MTALVHESGGDPQRYSVLECVGMIQNIVQLCPCFVSVRPTHDNTLADTPCLSEMTVSDHFVFQPVILCVNAAGQDQHALRQLNIAAILALSVILPAGHQCVLVLQITAVLP